MQVKLLKKSIDQTTKENMQIEEHLNKIEQRSDNKFQQITVRAKETKKEVAELEDLLKIQRATGDIVKHITDFAVDAVDKGPIHDLRS